MRLFYRLLAIALIAATTFAVSCEKPAPLPNEKSMAVTYATLDGSWQLTMWQGAAMAEETYLYIDFDRREHRYTMWDNIDSMYATDTTGTFTITEEEDGTYTLSGTYDYGMGDWSCDYQVILWNKGKSMKWQSRNGSHQVMEFVRVDEIPEFN